MVGGYLQAAGTWSLDDERPAVEADRSEGGEMYLRFDPVGGPTGHSMEARTGPDLCDLDHVRLSR
jgi:hypothetical protein